MDITTKKTGFTPEELLKSFNRGFKGKSVCIILVDTNGSFNTC